LSLKTSIVLVLVTAALLVTYKLVFIPSSIGTQTTPERIFVNQSSSVVVKVVPLNRLGLRVPFRHLKGRFIIREGEDMLEVTATTSDQMTFRTRGSPGKIVIYYYTDIIPFPIEIILNVESATVASLQSRKIIIS